MTNFSRLLTIAVTVLAVLFMGVTAVMTATRTDWKEVATKKFPKADIDKQTKQIKELDDQIAAFESGKVQARNAILADEKSIADPAVGREAETEKYLNELIAQANTAFQEADTQARKADAKLDELKLRREDTVRLQNQFDELVSQKLSAVEESNRLRDLLYQAEVVLERLQRRMKALEEETGKKPLALNRDQ